MTSVLDRLKKDREQAQNAPIVSDNSHTLGADKPLEAAEIDKGNNAPTRAQENKGDNPAAPASVAPISTPVQSSSHGNIPVQEKVADEKVGQELPVKPVEDDRRHLYSSPTSDGYSIQLSSGTKTAKAGLLKLNDADHKELQALLASGRPDISQNLVLLDPAAAEEIAKKHIAEQKAQAGRGAHHAGQGENRGGFQKIEPASIPGASDRTNAITGASAASVLANAVEEGAIHAEDTAVEGAPGKHIGAPRE